jgi:hypothetical protein
MFSKISKEIRKNPIIKSKFVAKDKRIVSFDQGFQD